MASTVIAWMHRRVPCVTFAFTAFVLVAMGCAALQFPRAYAAVNYDLVFPSDRVCRLDLHIRSDDWGAVVGDFERRKRDEFGNRTKQRPMQVSADVIVEGLLFRRASFRLGDDASLTDARTIHGDDRLAFHLIFDATSGQRESTLGGFTELAFSDAVPDSSYLRTSVVMELLREAGLPAPATAFMRVFLNHGDETIYLGVLTVLEVPGVRRVPLRGESRKSSQAKHPSHRGD